MTLLAWNAHLDTGFEVIDRQHHGLVDLINEVGPRLAHAGEAGVADPQPLLDRLFDYATVHFQTEEGLMASHGVHPEVLEHHRQTHARFVAEVSEMARRYAAGEGVSGAGLIAFLASWLVLHILGEDQAMARQLRARAAGLPAEAAYREARGGDLDPDPAALSEAFSDLYTRLTGQNIEIDQARGAIERYSHHLEDLVRERTAELERARDAAEAASVAKSRFLGTVSHELRTPMNAIVGHASLLAQNAQDIAEKAQAGRIVDASRHLLDIINQLVDYARLDAGEALTRSDQIFDVRALVEAACRPALARARAKGLDTGLDWAEGLARWRQGDPQHLAFILTQLVDNAVKFTAQGHIRVRIEAHGDGLRGLVEDTGIGIAEADRARLFTPFGQLDDRPNRQFEGLGLGLAMAGRLAQGLGGDIDFTSEPGQGSRFWFDLPYPAAPAPGTGVSDLEAPTPATPAAALAPAAALDREQVIRLGRLLGSNDTRANALFEQLEPGLRARFGAGVDGLAAAIADFDYETAFARLSHLMEAPRT